MDQSARAVCLIRGVSFEVMSDAKTESLLEEHLAGIEVLVLPAELAQGLPELLLAVDPLTYADHPGTVDPGAGGQ